MNFRRTCDKYIDDAHSRIADAEMRIAHSFSEKDITEALDLLIKAQRYLARAISAKDAWDSVEHDEYEEYPVIEYEEQTSWTFVET